MPSSSKSISNTVPLGVFESDQTGIYRQHSSPIDYVKVIKAADGKISDVKTLPIKAKSLSPKEQSAIDGLDDIFMVYRQYSYHSTLPLTRIIFKVKKAGKFLDKAVSQYKMDIKLPAHGSSHSTESYFKSKHLCWGKFVHMENT